MDFAWKIIGQKNIINNLIDLKNKDILQKSNEVNFSDLSLIMDNMKKFFKKQGYIVNLKDLEKRINETYK